MKYFIVFYYLAYFLTEILAVLPKTTPLARPKFGPQQFAKTAQLINFVNSVYSDAGHTFARSGGYDQFYPFKRNFGKPNTGQNKITSWLKSVIELLRSDKERDSTHEEKARNSVRLHIIDNPEELEDYQRKLKQKARQAPLLSLSESEKDSGSDNEEERDGKYSTVRRDVDNILLRKDNQEWRRIMEEYIEGSDLGTNIPDTGESPESPDNIGDLLKQVMSKVLENTEIQTSFPDEDEKALQEEVNTEAKDSEKLRNNVPEKEIETPKPLSWEKDEEVQEETKKSKDLKASFKKGNLKKQDSFDNTGDDVNKNDDYIKKSNNGKWKENKSKSQEYKPEKLREEDDWNKEEVPKKWTTLEDRDGNDGWGNKNKKSKTKHKEVEKENDRDRREKRKRYKNDYDEYSNKKDDYKEKKREDRYDDNNKKDNDRDKKDDDWNKKDNVRNKKDNDWNEKDGDWNKRDDDWNNKERNQNKKDVDWNKKDNGWQKTDNDWYEKDIDWNKKDTNTNKQDDDWNNKDSNINKNEDVSNKKGNDYDQNDTIRNKKDDVWDKKGNDWDPKEDNRNTKDKYSNIKKKKGDWDTKKYKGKKGKKHKKSHGSDEKVKEKRSDYDNYLPKSEYKPKESYERPHNQQKSQSFGSYIETPIPFDVKERIYADK